MNYSVYNNEIRNDLIDILRLIAVSFVLLDHYGFDSFKKGFVGVDIFFVISGYVISKSINRRISINGNDLGERLNFLFTFLIDRLARLLPSLLLCVICGILLVSYFDTPAEFGRHAVTGLGSLFGQANFILLFDSMDYFAPAADRNIFTHLWSLGVEFQFYFFIAICYALFNIKIAS